MESVCCQSPIEQGQSTIMCNLCRMLKILLLSVYIEIHISIYIQIQPHQHNTHSEIPPQIVPRLL